MTCCAERTNGSGHFQTANELRCVPTRHRIARAPDRLRHDSTPHLVLSPAHSMLLELLITGRSHRQAGLADIRQTESPNDHCGRRGKVRTADLRQTPLWYGSAVRTACCAEQTSPERRSMPNVGNMRSESGLESESKPTGKPHFSFDEAASVWPSSARPASGDRCYRDRSRNRSGDLRPSAALRMPRRIFSSVRSGRARLNSRRRRRSSLRHWSGSAKPSMISVRSRWS